MQLVDQVGVKRGAKHAEVTVPVGSAQNDGVMRILRANRRGKTLVQRLQHAPERLQRRVVRQRLIQQVVSHHRRVISIPVCHAPPKIFRLLLRALVRVQPWPTVAVVNVCTCLATRCSVQVQHHQQTLVVAPSQNAVQQCKTFRIIRRKQLPVHGYADGIKPHLLDLVDVITRDVGVPIRLPEARRVRRAQHLRDELLDLPL